MTLDSPPNDAAPSDPPASRPTRDRLFVAVLIIGGLSFICATLVGIFGEDLRVVESAAGDSYSVSAVGHHALAALLERRGLTVERSRARSGAKAGNSAVLLVADPRLDAPTNLEVSDPDGSDRASLEEVFAGADTAIFALPSWKVEPDRARRHIKAARRHDEDALQELLGRLGCEFTLRRARADARWTWADGIDREEVHREKVAIDLDRPIVAWAPSSELIPIVSCEDGVLVGRLMDYAHQLRDTTLYLITDADLLANHTLDDDNDHAWIVTNLIERLAASAHVRSPTDEGSETTRRVVIDEVVHGHEYVASFYRRLFSYPLIFVTIQVIGLIVILTWASLGRFGAVRRVSSGLDAGWRPLIANTADLLRHGHHYGHAITRYLNDTIRTIEKTLHRPPHLDEDGARAWLDDLARRRDLEQELHDVLERVAELANERRKEHAVVRLARRIHDLKQGLLNASR